MRNLLRLAALLILAAAGFVAWLVWYASQPVPLAGSPLEFSIPPGMGLKASAQKMEDAGIACSPWRFTLLGRLLGRAGAIKAGNYEVTAGITTWRLLEKLTRGDVSQREITFVEGRTFRQMREALDAHPDVSHDTLGLSDQEVLRLIGAAEAQAEGLFFPDTYLFAKASSDLDVLRRAYHAMQRRLSDEWAARAPNLPYRTPYQALILASIVEKETGRGSDRPEVAAVFVNRLRRGMLLQTDPTVIYGLGDRFDGNLRKKDLLADTPYNTYTRAGLPPTPIAMPGQASLRAVLQPPASDNHYFVARGDGSSAFSRTLEEHNRAVARYQKRKNR